MAKSKGPRDPVKRTKDIGEAVEKDFTSIRWPMRLASRSEHERALALNGTVTSYPQYLEAAANGCRASPRGMTT